MSESDSGYGRMNCALVGLVWLFWIAYQDSKRFGALLELFERSTNHPSGCCLTKFRCRARQTAGGRRPRQPGQGGRTGAPAGRSGRESEHPSGHAQRSPSFDPFYGLLGLSSTCGDPGREIKAAYQRFLHEAQVSSALDKVATPGRGVPGDRQSENQRRSTQALTLPRR